MSKVNELKIEGNQIITEKSQITLANLDPKNQKVIIWGYELCNGAEWKDFLNVVNKLGKEKANLEAKLEESEKEADKYWEFFNQEAKECAQLKQQLAEKEKEITDFELEVGDLRLQNRNLKEQFKFAVQSKNQDKISFCIEKLEKVKEFANLDKLVATFSNDYGGYEETEPYIPIEDLSKYINNQIEELKKEMKYDE